MFVTLILVGVFSKRIEEVTEKELLTGAPGVLQDMRNNPSLNNTIRDRALALIQDPNFIARFNERSELITKRNGILKLMTPAFWWVLSVSIAALVLLSAAYFVHARVPVIELPLIIAIVLVNIKALLITKSYIWTSLSD